MEGIKYFMHARKRKKSLKKCYKKKAEYFKSETEILFITLTEKTSWKETKRKQLTYYRTDSLQKLTQHLMWLPQQSFFSVKM